MPLPYGIPHQPNPTSPNLHSHYSIAPTHHAPHNPNLVSFPAVLTHCPGTTIHDRAPKVFNIEDRPHLPSLSMIPEQVCLLVVAVEQNVGIMCIGV